MMMFEMQDTANTSIGESFLKSLSLLEQAHRRLHDVLKDDLERGGERSLTALAFLFAVFRSRPSPFYVMDEVEAALDDVNLHRFLNLIQEFRREAQLLIVSHQKRTMEAGDALLGVSMQPGGSSKVVTERVTTTAPNPEPTAAL